MASAEREASYIAYVAAKQVWLRRVAFLLCRDWHRADDLVQITATKLYANWGRVGQIENLDGYARKVLINSYLAEQRSPWWKRVVPRGAAIDAEAPEPHEAHEESAPESAGQSDLDAVLDLRAALRTLAPRQRATLVLRYYDQLSVEETAHALGCSTGTVKSQTSRAMATLRRTLGAADADQDPPTEPPGPLVNLESMRPGGARL